MAASTLPASFQRNHLNPSATTSYDEFGASSIPTAAPSVNSWDEQIVPALRKRLEEESRRLDHRINHLETQPARRQPSQSRQQQVKAPRRLDRAHEVLQDGLGSDDLIPSGWATGSTAQFAAIAPRARLQADDHLRSASAHQPFNRTDHSPQEYAGSPSPTYLRETPSPTSPSRGNSPQSVSQAKDKARRLARDREAMEYGQYIPPSETLLGDTAHFDSTGEANWEQSRHHEREKDNSRARTISSPSLVNTAEFSEMDRPPVPAITPRTDSKAHTHADSAGGSSIPASRSVPRTQDHNAEPQDLRKTKSAARLSARQATRSQDSRESTANNVSTARAGPLRAIQSNKMSNQHVLDEFGPLGYTPPKKGRKTEGMTDDAEGGRSNQRSISNPWDEEMIPTVKKRLEQQRMMAGLSRDEDLVDTWDRHGLPLSKRQVSLRSRASEGRSPNKNGGLHLENSTDDGSEKMKRLHEQLDLGALTQSTTLSARTQERTDDVSGDRQDMVSDEKKRPEHTEMQERQRQPQQREMQEIHRQRSREEDKDQQPTREEQYQQYHHHEDQQHQQYPSPIDFASNNTESPAHQTNSTPNKRQEPILAEVDAAGCCKCTVM